MPMTTSNTALLIVCTHTHIHTLSIVLHAVLPSLLLEQSLVSTFKKHTHNRALADERGCGYKVHGQQPSLAYLFRL